MTHVQTYEKFHTITNFIGHYDRTGNKLCDRNKTFLISTRNKITARKPEKFLLLLHADHTKKYISSLFETNENTVFNFEYQRIRYKLILSELTAQIVSEK